MPIIKHQLRIMDAQTTSGVTSTVLGPGILSSIEEGVFYTTFDATSTAGVVELEGAPHEGYTGTWDSLATITWATADTTVRTNFTGHHLALRARITTTVTAGTVSVDFAGG